MDMTKYRTGLAYDDIVDGESCQVACPLHIDMPNYYDLMERGRFEDAYRLLKSANPFPAITGRVCYFPCEYSCVRGQLDTPVAIREVEYFLSDLIQSGENRNPELEVYKEGSLLGGRDEKVAIIGAGPAGMAAAWDLAHFGYRVTVFEKRALCGGMAHLGIPVYKLLGEVIEHEIEVLKRLGVTIKTETEVGKDITIDDLESGGYSAICVAVGADVGKRLRIPGEEGASAVYECTDILRLVRTGYREKLGEKIVIVGGGNSAMDIARTCRRLGTLDVTVVYRKSKDVMPAYDYEFLAAEREGVKFQFLAPPKSIEIENGKVVGLRCSRVDPNVCDNGGNGPLTAGAGSDFVVPADSIIRAISQDPNLSLLGDRYSVAVSERGLVKQEMERGITSLPGIFAAGDAITGPRSIVIALASGRRAAAYIDSFIREVDAPPVKGFSISSKRTAGVKGNFDVLSRQQAHKKIPLKIEQNFDLLVGKFTERQATEEYQRCLRCNHSLDIDSEECIMCNYCVDACPVDCLAMVSESDQVFSHESELGEGETGTAVMIRGELCIRCGICVEICPPEVISFKCFDID